ncbi:MULTISPECIES: hypothetical protein [unclassified Mycolicibacterium]|uniref:hypothetical protein n=1 Tax=unclassified Mycolicibacterium TaxID=2636767 RepID=UPI0012DEAABE|nr:MULTISPECIES: hypothetical protein [unclassified Mycolicibacterium]MUL84772.1 hypothetical protein [Mycolicibacterium sp. CBMA 329]MUL88547.1 hypothetical protein [Mycolicibacterium sp. CBMA 331]MUM00113.1 hypothetical protein [Mycolicibacterium sp. CBMA 334]MUM30289.1 hypothetical protein [Mycolicibacterium sp. CBMA 295]MUM40194.1 hypothetical protein [Mycolicibacterium sp. CBMA 247]
MTVAVGVVLSPILGLAAYGVSLGIVGDMLRSCRSEPAAGDGFIAFALLFPAVLTVAVTAITYTVVHLLIERNWSIYVAVAAAVIIAAVMVVYAINSQWSPVPTELCPTGTPSWWPWQVHKPH